MKVSICGCDYDVSSMEDVCEIIEDACDTSDFDLDEDGIDDNGSLTMSITDCNSDKQVGSLVMLEDDWETLVSAASVIDDEDEMLN